MKPKPIKTKKASLLNGSNTQEYFNEKNNVTNHKGKHHAKSNSNVEDINWEGSNTASTTKEDLKGNLNNFLDSYDGKYYFLYNLTYIYINILYRHS